MSARARVDAFEAWLRREGTPAEVALFNRSVAEGFIAVSGAGRVTAAHVEMSCKLARDVGMDTTAMEQLGALFVRFGDSAAVALLTAMAAEPEGAPATAAPEAPVRARSEPPRAGASAPVFEAPDDSDAPAPAPAAATAADAAPLVVSFRAATPSAASAPLDRDDHAAADQDEPAEITAPAPPSRRARGMSARTRLGAVIGVAALAAAALYATRGGDDRDGDPATGALAAIGVNAELPAGWRVAPDPRAVGALHEELVSRGGTPDDPDDRAFLAALPITEVLAAGSDVTSEAIVHAAQRAEHGTAARLTALGGTYVTGGCSASAGMAQTAVCRGTIRESGRTLALQTYLRVGGERAVVALFMAKLTVADPAGEADQVMTSLRL